MKSLQDQMLAEIEALREELAPEVPDYAITFEQMMQRLGPGANVGRLHKWLAEEVKAERWKKARIPGGQARTVYWKCQ
jgi:hypothetical protein